jgi:hypothetical protein
MDFRIFAFASLIFVVACSNPNTKKAPAEENGVAAGAMPVEQKNVAQSTSAVSDVTVPDDVNQFIVRREQCDHFRGEEAYDEERGRFLAQKLDSFCKGTDGELAALKRKYAVRGDLTKRLSEFESMIE